MRRSTRSLAFVVATLALAAATVQSQAPPRVTTPQQQFGHEIGADYVLPNYTQLVEYWQKLDRESDRMQLVDIGKTAEGRSRSHGDPHRPENLKKLDRYREIARRLALAEGLTDDQARQLAAEGKAVVWIDGGLHATEVLGAQQLMETRLPDGQPERPRDAALPARRHHPGRARQPGRAGAGRRLVHAREGADEAIDRRHPAALPEVHRPRQQPRLLPEQPAGDRATSAASCTGSGSRRSSTTTTRPARPARCCSRRRSATRSTTTSTRWCPPGIDLVGAAMHNRFVAEGKPGATMRSGRELLDVVERRAAHRRSISTT